jgi:hypothetical protein
MRTSNPKLAQLWGLSDGFLPALLLLRPGERARFAGGEKLAELRVKRNEHRDFLS